MKLRKLKSEDAELMLEWMKDDSVVHDLKSDFLKMTIDNCKNFIKRAKKQYVEDKPCNLHYAITDEANADFDEYLGTVSLKNIDYIHHSAEFAIAVRHKAMGTGLAKYAMEEIIEIGFERLGLHLIYWYVSPENIRANRFYKKNGYKNMSYNIFDTKHKRKYQTIAVESNLDKYVWYCIEK